MINVQGFNWQRGPITIYLVPESEQARLDGEDTGELYVLGESQASSTGEFYANRLILGAELSSEDGMSRMTLARGKYFVAAKGTDGLRVALAKLTIQ